MATCIERQIRFLRRWLRRCFAAFALPGALTFDLAERLFGRRPQIRALLWPTVIMLSLFEWSAVFLISWALEFNDDAAACVRGDACVQWVTDSTDWPLKSPTDSPSSALDDLSVLRSPVFLSLRFDVEWTLRSLLTHCIKIPLLWIYLMLVLLAKILTLMVLHPKGLCFLCCLGILLLLLVVEDANDGNSEDTAERSDAK
jgi:hypothetical protein